MPSSGRFVTALAGAPTTRGRLQTQICAPQPQLCACPAPDMALPRRARTRSRQAGNSQRNTTRHDAAIGADGGTFLRQRRAVRALEGTGALSEFRIERDWA